ncbi:hypothetical protein GGX14DRAFT_424905 [Mycena pura]|uniref:EthD domain-containing protein n=1 Tax=Mycena pura TaxID=153505 RepID=A0AAD6YN30_9AGAR|nr:hypothetical protein GGX14DRAFT_424905 [Mycena pura]
MTSSSLSLPADWCNAHVPRRLAAPGVTSAVLYKAVDSLEPKWLTMYDTEAPVANISESYAALEALGSDKEKAILSNIRGLSRRTYEHMRTFTHSNTTAASLPAKYILAVGFIMTPDGEDELDKWYNEEHMDLLSKVPGWKQGRRFKLVEYNQRGDSMAGKPVHKYLAFHSFDNQQFAGTPEFKHATGTEWRGRVMEKCLDREARVFEVYRNFGKQ